MTVEQSVSNTKAEINILPTPGTESHDLPKLELSIAGKIYGSDYISYTAALEDAISIINNMDFS